MKAISFIITASVLILSACSSTYHLQDGDITLNEISRELADDNLSIKLIDGQELNAENLMLAPEFSSYLSEDGNRVKIATTKINQILIKNHGQGALEGSGLGFAGGFTAGALIGLLSFDPDKEPGWFGPDSYGSAAMMAGVLIAIPTTAAGLVIGTIAGHRETYIINDFPQPSAKTRFIKVRVSSVTNENGIYVTVKYRGSIIKIKRSHIKSIDRPGDRIFITIPADLYEREFKN